jgi:hypothetical protein
MRRVIFYVNFIMVVIAFASCRKTLDIPAITTNANILVVEGLINIGADSTKIKLSRTVVIGNKKTANPEANALVTIENAQGMIATLKQTVAGTYVSPGLNLTSTQKYRVRIRTNNGKTYLSDLVEAKVTPPIDSVGYTFNSNGIQLYANSHDQTNTSRYYFYNYTETWQFHAAYQSRFISDGRAIQFRTPAQDVYYCFNNSASANVVINSTASLVQDVTYHFPITTVDATSEKLQMKYSILVTQTALTKEGYAFWENLKKNTEQLGSIFDAQPSVLTGNVHNVADAGEPVIGYISAANTQSKRLFINYDELPSSFVVKYPYDCLIDTARFKTENGFNEVDQFLVPLPNPNYALNQFGPGPPEGYTFSNANCSDCTIRGTTKQPIFWK